MLIYQAVVKTVAWPILHIPAYEDLTVLKMPVMYTPQWILRLFGIGIWISMFQEVQQSDGLARGGVVNTAVSPRLSPHRSREQGCQIFSSAAGGSGVVVRHGLASFHSALGTLRLKVLHTEKIKKKRIRPCNEHTGPTLSFPRIYIQFVLAPKDQKSMWTCRIRGGEIVKYYLLYDVM
jgi:hypothetical protein